MGCAARTASPSCADRVPNPNHADSDGTTVAVEKLFLEVIGRVAVLPSIIERPDRRRAVASLIAAVELRDAHRRARFQEAASRNQSRKTARRVRAAAEAKDENLVAGSEIFHEPLIGIRHGAIQTITEDAAADPLPKLRADPGVVINVLLDASRVGSRAERLQPPDVGVVADGVPGPVEKYGQPLLGSRNLRLEAPPIDLPLTPYQRHHCGQASVLTKEVRSSALKSAGSPRLAASTLRMKLRPDPDALRNRSANLPRVPSSTTGNRV